MDFPMQSINIHEAKTHLSRYAKKVKAGATIELCDRNRPFARITPLPKSTSSKPVKFGVAKGSFDLPEDFNAPLTEFESDFYGEPQTTDSGS